MQRSALLETCVQRDVMVVEWPSLAQHGSIILPMFVYSLDRKVNCFVDPSCEAYAPLLELVRCKGILKCSIQVPMRSSEEACIVSTKV